MLFIIATKPQSNTDDKQLGISKGDASSSKDLGSQLKKIAIEKEIEVVSMDDESVFGKILYESKQTKKDYGF